MKIFLTLKHWHLIVCLVGLTIVNWLTDDSYYSFLIAPVLALCRVSIILGWFFTVGTFLFKSIANGKKDPTFFRTHITITLLLALLTYGYEAIAGDIIIPVLDDLLAWVNTLFSVSIITCFFRSGYIVARTLNMVEMQSEVKLNDYIRDLISLIFFVPFGLLVCQPRVNDLFAEKSHN